MFGKPETIDNDAMLGIYNSLQHGDEIEVTMHDCYSNGDVALVVTSAHRIVGKSKVGRIILKAIDNPNGCKFVLYNRDGKVSMARGDMGTIIVAASKR